MLGIDPMALTGARPETMRLSVHRRYVLDRQGQLHDEAFVQCPVEQEPVLLVECSRCGHCAARLADSHGAVMIDCVPPADAPGARQIAPVDRHPVSNDPVSAASRTRALGFTVRNTLCVRPDMDLTHAAGAVQRIGSARVVVVDSEMRPLGVLANSEIERAGRVASSPYRLCAGDIMRPTRASLPTDVTISLASAAMAETGAEEVPLVGREGDVVAVLRAIDIIRWFATLEGYVLSSPVDPTLDTPGA